jgi:pimeloyl-ACP methyl ester carboxylesterase
MSTRRVERAGAVLAVEVHGHGLPVLFLHGFPLDRRMWRHQSAALAQQLRIVPDLRAAGESAGAPVESLGDYADDVVGILDALEISVSVVCGLSMGGYIALDLVRRYPQRVRGLVLADTRAAADDAGARRARDEMIELARTTGSEAVAERMLPRVLSPRTLSGRPDVVREVRSMMEGWSGAAMIGALRAMRDRPDATSLLGHIRVPTLVMVGDDDAVTPPSEARRIAEAVPGARLVTLPEAGHLSPLEQPRASTEALALFFESL